jgi:hypothetical protein
MLLLSQYIENLKASAIFIFGAIIQLNTVQGKKRFFPNMAGLTRKQYFVKIPIRFRKNLIENTD